MNTRSQVNEDGSTPMCSWCSWIARSITEGYPAKAEYGWKYDTAARRSVKVKPTPPVILLYCIGSTHFVGEGSLCAQDC